jgi:hypothetical protein
MKVSYEHLIPAPYDKVIEAYKSTLFYEEKQKSSGALSVEILETEDLPPNKFRMKAKVSEPSRVPAFLRKSDVDTYVDDTLLDPDAGTVTWKITPDKMSEVFLLSGRIDFVAKGDQTSVTYNTELRVQIPIVGKKAEKIGLEKTQQETRKQADFLKQWVKEK